ncbi:hypothetical protein C0J52_22970 [Blattella germanica]|nr:hypothetical protein C0J52_22970 [Blattella germanica]
MKEKIQKHREVIKKLKKNHRKTKLGAVTVGMVYKGMRGVPALLCETSSINPKKGIRFRGYTISDLLCKLPKPKSGKQPFPEGVFWLMCTGDIPTQEQVDYVRQQWIARSDVPQFIIDLLLGLPKQLNPMAQLSSAISAMCVCSEFCKNYNKVKREDMWELMYEDCMDLLAKITSIASIIYTHTYRECGYKPIIEEDNCWTRNFCISMTYEENDFIDFMRLYLLINSDMGGSVSSHAVHLVGSALSNCYLAFAAGINGLAGPLDGLAVEEAWKFVAELQEKYCNAPSDDEVKCFVKEKLKCGLIPGYGHSILQTTDPRFSILQQYCEKALPCDPGVQIVWQLFKIVPPILHELGKMNNPCANINAHTGAILQVRTYEDCLFQVYVLTAVSRALGTMASLIWSRALLLPLERPISFTTKEILTIVSKDKCAGIEDTCKQKNKQATDTSCLHAPVVKVQNKEEEKTKKRVCLSKEEKPSREKDICKPNKEDKPKKKICYPKEEKKKQKEDTCKPVKTEIKCKDTEVCKPKKEEGKAVKVCLSKEEKPTREKDICKTNKEDKPKKKICYPKEEKIMWGQDICKKKQKEDVCKPVKIEIKCKDTEEVCKPKKEEGKAVKVCLSKEEKPTRENDICKPTKDDKPKKKVCFPKEEKIMWGEDICKKIQKENVCKPITTENKCKDMEDVCKLKKEECKAVRDKCSSEEEQKTPDFCKIDITKLDEICKTKKGLCD